MSTQLRTPLKQVRGLGSARGGTRHFISQRITAIALVPLCLWFLWISLSLLHLDYAASRALIAQPCNSALMIAFVLAVFWHAQLGVQVVIEDYVTTHALEMTAQLLVKLFAALGAIVAVLAIARIALGS